MAGFSKVRAIRAIVRPDRRDEYLTRWTRYADAVSEIGGGARLFEDQMLPGRFLELTEHLAEEGMAAALERAVEEAGLRGLCVRREGEDVYYREAGADRGTG